MPIKCMLCNEEFGQITGSHLKSAHNMDSLEYQRMFPNAGIMSEEAWRKISEANVGNQNALGCVRSKETKQLLREAQMGHVTTEETRRRMSEANTGNQYALGHVHTEESKQLMREAALGNKCAMGNVHTEETRQKMREASLGNQYHLGLVHTEEAKQKMREAMMKNWKDPEFQRRWSESVHMRPNEPECQLQSVLDKHFPGEWKYTGDGTFWIKGKNPDFTNVNGKKQVIEIFGYYWHDDDEVEPRIAHFKEYGFDCIIFWEFDVYDEEEVVGRVKTFKE